MARYLNQNQKTYTVGDTIQVHAEVKEGDKTRVQIFEGILISIDNRESNKMICVRKIGTNGVGVERIFPVDAPMIKKILIKRHGDVRRAKLHYLRKRVGKLATKVKQGFTT